MLSRMDANGNGSLDPEELQGPARFMLDRLGRDNEEISKALASGKPISISKITKAIETVRSGDSGNSSRSNSNNPPTNGTSATAEPEPLVPGFGVKTEPKPVLGFGPEGNDPAAAVVIEERDLKDATERIERYDKNKDGILDESEVAEGRWSDNPWSFDRNRDKKLTEKELAVRYAKRRATEDASRSQSASSNSTRSSRGSREGDREQRSKDREAAQSPWANQASFKYAPQFGQGSKVQGLPQWFSSSDVNADGQVMMNEYASNWDEAIINEFNKFDTNGDGSITTLEALAAVKKGIMRGSSSGGGASSSNSSGSQGSTGAAASMVSGSSSGGSSSTTASSSSAPIELDKSGLPAGADDRWAKFFASKISKSDKDKNGRLTPDEWSASDGDFASIDTNGDGSISLGEYYTAKKK
jgi:Ca2+-binding EF-hand superfamily protein